MNLMGRSGAFSLPSVSIFKRCLSGRQTVTLIPGDGVGPELMSSVESVFSHLGVPLDFEVSYLSEVHPALSSPIKEVAASIRKNKFCLKGILDTPHISAGGELATLNQKLRKELDLFANVVHVKSLPGVNVRHSNIDFVIIREQIEGEYSALEHESVKGVVECLKIVTAERSRKIAKFAFDYATKHHRSKITAIHKANIMKLGDGLFLRSCQEISELYPSIKFESMIVDNCSMQLVSNPTQFDVLVTPNLYGHVINNLGVGLVGGAGLVSGESYSSEVICYEPGARHAFSEATGKDVANPTAMLLASAKMLQNINLEFYASKIANSVHRVLLEGKVKTKDLGGHSSTSEFTKAILQHL